MSKALKASRVVDIVFIIGSIVLAVIIAFIYFDAKNSGDVEGGYQMATVIYGAPFLLIVIPYFLIRLFIYLANRSKKVEADIHGNKGIFLKIISVLTLLVLFYLGYFIFELIT